MDEFFNKIEKEKHIVNEIMNALARFILRCFLLQDLKTDEKITVRLMSREDIWSYPKNDQIIQLISDNFPEIFLEKICDCYFYLNDKINPSAPRVHTNCQKEEIISQINQLRKVKKSKKNQFQNV